MKLSIAIASRNALPTAFVVFRGFEECAAKASSMGYDGMELSLKSPDEITRSELDSILAKTGLEISCISTGQAGAVLGYAFTEEDGERRRSLDKMFRDFIDLASDHGQLVNIGRVRGPIGSLGRARAEELFIDLVRPVCDYAQRRGVTIILEPINRYEIDFINTVEDGVELVRRVDHPAFKLMADIFHMNIEDRTIGGEIERHIDDIKYIHLADSNRHSPGQGHTDFADLFKHTHRAGYRGWFSVEILPYPDPDLAAARSIQYLRQFDWA